MACRVELVIMGAKGMWMVAEPDIKMPAQNAHGERNPMAKQTPNEPKRFVNF